MLLTHHLQDQPPPEGDDSAHKKDEQGEDKKQKENTAYAKKMVLRLAGIMGLGSTVGIVYIFGEFACCFLMLRVGTRGLECYKLEDCWIIQNFLWLAFKWHAWIIELCGLFWIIMKTLGWHCSCILNEKSSHICDQHIWATVVIIFLILFVLWQWQKFV